MGDRNKDVVALQGLPGATLLRGIEFTKGRRDASRTVGSCVTINNEMRALAERIFGKKLGSDAPWTIP